MGEREFMQTVFWRYPASILDDVYAKVLNAGDAGSSPDNIAAMTGTYAASIVLFDQNGLKTSFAS